MSSPDPGNEGAGDEYFAAKLYDAYVEGGDDPTREGYGSEPDSVKSKWSQESYGVEPDRDGLEDNPSATNRLTEAAIAHHNMGTVESVPSSVATEPSRASSDIGSDRSDIGSAPDLPGDNPSAPNRLTEAAIAYHNRETIEPSRASSGIETDGRFFHNEPDPDSPDNPSPTDFYVRALERHRTSLTQKGTSLTQKGNELTSVEFTEDDILSIGKAAQTSRLSRKASVGPRRGTQRQAAAQQSGETPDELTKGGGSTEREGTAAQQVRADYLDLQKRRSEKEQQLKYDRAFQEVRKAAGRDGQGPSR
jgi:hypothetical protein